MTIEYFSGNQGFQASNVLWTIHCVCNDNRQLAGNTCEEHIRFCGGVISGLPSGDAHVDFEAVDGPFHDRSYLIGVISLFGIALDTGEHT